MQTAMSLMICRAIGPGRCANCIAIASVRAKVHNRFSSERHLIETDPGDGPEIEYPRDSATKPLVWLRCSLDLR